MSSSTEGCIAGESELCYQPGLPGSGADCSSGYLGQLVDHQNKQKARTARIFLYYSHKYEKSAFYPPGAWSGGLRYTFLWEWACENIETPDLAHRVTSGQGCGPALTSDQRWTVFLAWRICSLYPLRHK